MGRRRFLDLLVAAVQAGIGCLLAVPGARFALHPLRRSAKEAPFLRVAPVSAVSADRPIRVPISTSRRDAYTEHPPAPVGSVWLVRGDDARGEPHIRCFQTICPHLGCGVNYSEERTVFSCPCHASDFDLGGRRMSGPSPRDMDELECRISRPDEGGRRWVELRYRIFQVGEPEQIPIT